MGGPTRNPNGWGNSEEDLIGELADKFLQKYQRIKVVGKGSDRPYAEWYQDMLKKTEPDGTIYFWRDGDYEVDRPYIGILNCGRRKINIPYPLGYLKQEGCRYPVWL